MQENDDCRVFLFCFVEEGLLLVFFRFIAPYFLFPLFTFTHTPPPPPPLLPLSFSYFFLTQLTLHLQDLNR